MDKDIRGAAIKGDLSELQRLVTRENVNNLDKKDFTALHWVVGGGHFHCIQPLLDLGADINAVNKFQKTPLKLALGFGPLHYKRVECAKCLLLAGADIQAGKAMDTPEWMQGIPKCRKAVLCFLGLQRFRSASVMNISHDMARLIAKLLWGTRVNSEWL